MEIFKASSSRRQCDIRKPRWDMNCLNLDMLLAAANAISWPGQFDESESAQKIALQFQREVTNMCDVGMSRLNRKDVYWWSQKIADLLLREKRIKKKLCHLYFRKSKIMLKKICKKYKTVYNEFRLAVKETKKKIWDEFIKSLDMNFSDLDSLEIRFRESLVTESLDPKTIEEIIDEHFPRMKNTFIDDPPEIPADQTAWSDNLRVTPEELSKAVTEMKERDTPPGPDGVNGMIWSLIVDIVELRLRSLLNACLKQGVFPSIWKQGNMILIPKESIEEKSLEEEEEEETEGGTKRENRKEKPNESPSAYYSVCLFNKIGKLFEHIIAARLIEHLKYRKFLGNCLTNNEFRFREGRSMVNAIKLVRSIAKKMIASNHKVVFAVSIKLMNVFNSLPWGLILKALDRHKVPLYLQRVIQAYFSDRYIMFPIQGCRMAKRKLYCGVPQGTILAPLLCDLTYRTILQNAGFPKHTKVMCYSDDILVFFEKKFWKDAKVIAESAVAHFIKEIKHLRLQVSFGKTEILGFFDNCLDGLPVDINVTL